MVGRPQPKGMKRNRPKKAALMEKNKSLIAELVKVDPVEARQKEKKMPKPSLPKPPSGVLDEVGKCEWDRISELLFELGQLTELDCTALLMYCDAYADFIQACREINKEKRALMKTGKKNGGLYRNPWLDIKKTAVNEIYKYLALFGLSPAARNAWVSFKNKVDEKANDFDEFVV